MTDDKMHFGFDHMSEEGNWTFNKSYDYGTRWSTVLTDFLSFMSGIYGYSLHEKVDYDGNPSFSYAVVKEEEDE